MLALHCSLTRRLSSKGESAATWTIKPKRGLQRSSLKCYSTIRRRVASQNSEASSSSYSKLDSASAEKRKKDLDKEFDDLFFRKPKVLIIGTNVSAMTTGKSLQNIFKTVSSIISLLNVLV